VSIRPNRLLPSMPHERLLDRCNSFLAQLLHQLRVLAKDPILLTQLRVLAADPTPRFLRISCLGLLVSERPNRLLPSLPHERLLDRRNPSFHRPVLRAQQRVLAHGPILLAQLRVLARDPTPTFLALSCLGLRSSHSHERLLARRNPSFRRPQLRFLLRSH